MPRRAGDRRLRIPISRKRGAWSARTVEARLAEYLQRKAKDVKLGRGNKKDGERSADEERWGMSRAELEKRILRLHKGGTGILKIGKALGTGTVQRVLMEEPRPFEVGASA
jgi:hypothetical protein